MCGIAGYISKQSNISLEKIIKSMCDSVAHRGPDGAGSFVVDNLALGHRRLSIIDLSDLGHQPMTDPVSGYVISFNGEIYNYIEIREHLISSGYQFHSNTDTEVILKAYDLWGTSCIEKFNGMWAFAIYDPKNKLVFCSRDRFGVKPFYYIDNCNTFAFGSEIRQLLPFIPQVAADSEVLSGFLVSRIAEAKIKTFFHGVTKLPGGHNLIYDLLSNSYTIKRYYSIEEKIEYLDFSPEDVFNSFRGIFEDAIQIRLRSDVQVGTCLSGGLDSSSIATIAAEKYRSQCNNPFSAITAISEDPASDESNFAKMIVNNSGLEWITIKPTYHDFCQALGFTVKAQEEPFSSASVIMQYLVMQSARRSGIPVLLDGQGGDETLLGYERYFADYSLQLLKTGNIYACIGFLGGLKKNGRPGTFRSLIWNLLYFHANGLKRFAKTGQGRIFNTAFESITHGDSAFSRRYASFFEMQKLEIEHTNLPVLLRYEDKNSMWHSIETRLPFLDYRLVEFALSIKTAIKLNNGWGKFLLRKSMEAEMPREIVWRKNKFGFEAPETKWMGLHSAVVNSTIKNSTMLAEICNKGALENDQLDNLNAGLRWRLFSTALWAREFGVEAIV